MAISIAFMMWTTSTVWARKSWSGRTTTKKSVLILALNCYQHCLESRSFDKASYFEAYVEKIIGKGIKLYERNVFLYLKGFAAYQKEQKKQGIKQMQEAMHIFEVLELPEQVAYYQEHFHKFVKA